MAFLAGVALTFGAVLAPPLVFFTGSSTVSSTLGVSTFSGDSFLAFVFLDVLAGLAVSLTGDSSNSGSVCVLLVTFLDGAGSTFTSAAFLEALFGFSVLVVARTTSGFLSTVSGS